jgi:CRP-like cAMP-binding protein
VRFGRRVDLFEAEPDLAVDLDLRQEDGFRASASVEVINVPEGTWSPPETVSGDFGGLGLLVLEGVMLRRETLAGARRSEPIGPGDLIRPLACEEDPFSRLPTEIHWRALSRARLAVLDDAFTRRMCNCGAVLDRIVDRHSRRLAAAAQRDVIRAQEEPEARLLHMLWHLANRFGRVTRDGVVIPIPLSQGDIGEFLGVSRHAVLDALKPLRDHRVADQRRDMTWWLAGAPVAGVAELANANRPVGV